MYYLSFLFIMSAIFISPSLYAINSELDPAATSQPETSQYCKSVQDAGLSLLDNYKDENFSNDLIEYSKSYPVDNDCYRWQLLILNKLRKLSLQPVGYRDYMFARIPSMDDDFKSEFMLHIFRYSLEFKPLSEKEWDTVKASLQVSSEITVLSIMLGLVASSSEGDVELHKQIADLFMMAKANNLAAPEQVDLSRAVELFLTISITQRPDLFASYYNKYFYLLDESGMDNITTEAIEFFNDNQNEVGIKFIGIFIDNASAENGIDKNLFSLLYKMHKEKEFSGFYHHAVTVLVESHPDNIRDIIINANLNRMKKDLLVIEYQLDRPGEYSVEKYALQLFDAKIRKQQKAAEYLVAFGTRSKLVKQDVINKLMSIKISKDKVSSTKLIISLLKVLENIDAQDQQAINVFLWALSDTDPTIQRQARSGLESIGPGAMSEYNKNFKTYSVRLQALVIEIMGNFDSGKVTAIKFLSRVTPRNDQMKFAIDDAVAELNEF